MQAYFNQTKSSMKQLQPIRLKFYMQVFSTELIEI
jgi:hypothetical protein